jgi:hypothetical protein
MADKLLIELENFTMLRGAEKRQEVYFVFLGYDPEGKASAKARNLAVKENPELDPFVPAEKSLKKYFYMGSSPIFRVRKHRTHVFPGGYPIYYDVPSDIVSFYMAVVESDRGARKIFPELFKSKGPARTLLDQAVALLKVTKPELALIQEAFGLIIKAVELVILQDDIRYTNVLTFKKHDGYLAGTHDSWGNQRVAFTIESLPPSPDSA